MDTIHPDMSWTIVYGRSLKSSPKKLPSAKALVITVRAPADATLTLETASGDFSFQLDEVPEVKKIEALDGNVTISLAEELSNRKKKSKTDLPPAKIASVIDAIPGDAYYYVRVFQRDPEDPDGDPEIAWSSPVFVNDK